jgi:PBP4 family serine-type D-alanyl-D-alanine carboxypeptidase
MKKTGLRLRFAALAALIALCCPVFAGSMQTSVEELLKARKYDRGGMGVVVRDLRDDSIVVSVNADVPMNPASVQKLITGAAAFELLGPTYTFNTRIYTDGTFQADSGVINGNLYVKGGGNPGLNAEKLWLLVQHLRHRGIRRVTGGLFVDNTFFDDVSLGPGFSEEESRSYQALISALPVNYSSVAVHHRPGQSAGSPVHVDIFPKIEGFKVNSTATTIEHGRPQLDVSTSLNNGVTQINLRGTMKTDEQPAYTYRRMWTTWEAFGGAFRAQCADNGIRIEGKTAMRRVPDTLAVKGVFYTFGGEPLTEFTRHMLKWSSNFIAEMLFKTIGAVRLEEPGTWPKGAKAVTEWWGSRGLPGTPHVINGSGMGGESSILKRSAKARQEPASLDHQTLDTTELGAIVAAGADNEAAAAAPVSGTRIENLVSAGQMVELLTYVSKQKSYFPDFLASLPVSGVDGTLSSRFKRSKLKGIVRAKTGTINSIKVSTLAGYMLLDDRTYAFAVFCKNVGPNQYDNWIMQEQILETVAKTVDGGWK